jgi:hypothetical protein
MNLQKLLIMIAGPYRGGSSDKLIWDQNHKELNKVAFAVFQRGHLPIIGVNAALPIIEQSDFVHFDYIMMPLSLALADRCDAILRIGGYSSGADMEVAVFKQKGLKVFTHIDEIERCRP